MLAEHLDKHLEIRKNGSWELWLISPTKQTLLGSFPTLGELNQAQITLYHCWEHARFSRRAQTGPLRG